MDLFCHITLGARSRKFVLVQLGADGGTRTLTGLLPTDFHTTSVFAAALEASDVRGLDYPFTIAALAVGAARLVSTPSRRFGLGSGLAWS